MADERKLNGSPSINKEYYYYYYYYIHVALDETIHQLSSVTRIYTPVHDIQIIQRVGK